MKVLAYHLDQILVFALLIITVGICWPPTAYFDPTASALPVSDPYSTVFNAVLIGFLVVACFVRGEAMGPLLRSAWPALPLVALAFLSAFWSSAPDIVLTRAIKIVATAIFGLYLIARGDMPGLIALFVKATLVAAGASFIIAFTSPKLVLASNSEYVNAWRGAFTDKNELGIVAALGFLAAAYAFRYRYGSRFLSGLAVPANLILLWLSDSITATLIVPMSFYLFALGGSLRRRNSAGMFAVFGLVVLGLVAIVVAVSMYSDILVAVGRNATLSNRTRIWQVVIPYIEQRPWLGYGLESFWLPDSLGANQIWQILQWQTPHSHNMWLEMCLSLGLIGAFFCAFLWFNAVWRAAIVLIRGQTSDAAFALVLLASVFVANLTEFDFFRGDDIQWMLFAAAAGYLGRAALRRPVASAAAIGAPRQPLPVPASAYRAAQ